MELERSSLKPATSKAVYLSAVLRSDGSGGDMLGIPTVGSEDLYHSDFSPEGHKMHKMYMNGGEVFKFATRVIAESIEQALVKAGIGIEDLSLIVPHQANARIIQAAARSLKVDPELFAVNLNAMAIHQRHRSRLHYVKQLNKNG